ncbi:MAG: dihydropteroate synthase [Synergistaceae bacterium]|jgi:dihydropteroate synthase|nr:dihydropteroate synthase [Synergistaceae bacterium]
MPLAGGRSISFGRTLVMGILNMTGDSFFAPSRLPSARDALERACAMVRDGADIIDIGAESTRPGSRTVPEDDEIAAVVPAISAIRGELPQIPISVDTRRAKTARLSIEAGADIINDVSGLDLPGESDEMTRLISGSGAPYVLTHTKGTPDIMQQDVQYEDFWAELMDFFGKKIESLSRAGASTDRVILDPGVGFGKRRSDNVEIVANAGELRKLGFPVLIGASRKGFIGRILQLAGLESQASPEDCLEGTLAVTALCAAEGIEIVRVHDVKENRRAVETADAIRRARHRGG